MIYVEYLKNELEEIGVDLSAGQIKKYTAFKENLHAGITYYQMLFSRHKQFINEQVEKQIETTKSKLDEMIIHRSLLAIL